MSFLGVYVGKYQNIVDSKKDSKTLNEMGYRAYTFSMGDYYSLKVASFPTEMLASMFCEKLKKMGFDSFVK